MRRGGFPLSGIREFAKSLIRAVAKCLSLAQSYFFFFPPGITLATALAIEPATFATTPFLEARFFAFGFVAFEVGLVDRAFGAVSFSLFSSLQFLPSPTVPYLVPFTYRQIPVPHPQSSLRSP